MSTIQESLISVTVRTAKFVHKEHHRPGIGLWESAVCLLGAVMGMEPPVILFNKYLLGVCLTCPGSRDTLVSQTQMIPATVREHIVT